MKAVVGIISSLFVGIVLFISMPYINDHLNAIPFDSHQWINAEIGPEKNWKDRWNMRRDLLANYELKGKSKDEVIELLGKASQETKNAMYYNLGPAILGIDVGTLVIKLENKKVQSLKVSSG